MESANWKIYLHSIWPLAMIVGLQSAVSLKTQNGACLDIDQEFKAIATQAQVSWVLDEVTEIRVKGDPVSPQFNTQLYNQAYFSRSGQSSNLQNIHFGSPIGYTSQTITQDHCDYLRMGGYPMMIKDSSSHRLVLEPIPTSNKEKAGVIGQIIYEKIENDGHPYIRMVQEIDFSAVIEKPEGNVSESRTVEIVRILSWDHTAQQVAQKQVPNGSSPGVRPPPQRPALNFKRNILNAHPVRNSLSI